MATGEAWSAEEVRATVQDYMQMLQQEHAGVNYNKSVHRRALQQQLHGRSDGSIELKHQNISAILHELGRRWIGGYKPRANYQQLLAEEVTTWLKAHPNFEQLEQATADAPAVVPSHVEFGNFIVQPPTFNKGYTRPPKVKEDPNPLNWASAFKRDYLAREARNSSLGKAGEQLVVRYEQERLARTGHDRLADKVQHVSETHGDGLGFDILSFDQTGRELFIEVKTTAFVKETPFFASYKEVDFARAQAKQFQLFRVFDFKHAPKCFILPGQLEDHCSLDPINFRCSFRET